MNRYVARLVFSCAAAIPIAISPVSVKRLDAAAESAGDAFLTEITVIEPSGKPQANEALTFGLPLAPGRMTAGQSLKVVDPDTGSQIPCEDDNRASDITTGIRFETPTCILPKQNGGTTKTLKAYITNAPPPTGTDITISDITTAFAAASSFDVVATFTNVNGAEGNWTASLVAALSTAKTGFANGTTSAVLGKYRSGGGLATEYVVLAPALRSGVADPQLHVIFDLLCFKASRAAVDAGSNPILKCRVDASVENAWIQASAPVDNFYGFQLTAGGITVANYPVTSPAATLTLATASQAQGQAIVASTGILSVDSQGRAISDGKGLAVINGYRDSTHAIANIYHPMAGTILTSGNWKLYGIAHTYGARFRFRSWFGAQQAQPEVDKGTLYVGHAWSNGSLQGGPASYFIGSMLLPNWQIQASSLRNDMSNIEARGSNPMAYYGGGLQFGSGGFMSDIQLYLETSGGRGDIGIIPEWDMAALVRYDKNATNRIFTNAERWASFPQMFRDQKTGKAVSPCNRGALPNCASSVNWVNDSRFAGTAIHFPANTISPWSGDGVAHDPQSFYLAALLTGDFYWIENLQMQAAAAPMNMNSTGTGIGRTQFLDPAVCCGLQERGVVWSVRNIIDAVLLTPDASPAVLGITKSVGQAWVNSQWDDPLRGSTALFLKNTDTGSGKWARNGPHYTVVNNNSFASFELGYATFEWAHAKEQGMLNAGGNDMFAWYAANQIQAVNDPAVDGKTAARLQYGALFDVTSGCPGRPAKSWQNAYKATSILGPFGFGAGNPRLLPGSATVRLSASSGPGINVSITGGVNWLNTMNFYPGMWIYSQDGGAAKILSVSSPTAFTASTMTSQQFWSSAGGGSCNPGAGHAFRSMTYESGFYLPQAAPGDPQGKDWLDDSAGNPGSEYLILTQAGTIYASQFGLPGGSAAFATATGWTEGSMRGTWPRWWVAPRPGSRK